MQPNQMVEIQIVYRHYFCDCIGCEDKFSTQCLSEYAAITDCKGYSDGGIDYYDRESMFIMRTYGDCVHAKWKYKIKGWFGNRYEMSTLKDPFNNCMRVWLGKTEYDCVKVILDGKCIYNNGETEQEVNGDDA